jgi:hypothetical protein
LLPNSHFLLPFTVTYATLYGYIDSPSSRHLIVIDPKTSSSKIICDLSSLPSLSGGSSSANVKDGILHFFIDSDQDNDANVSLVKVNPYTCAVSNQLVQGLNEGQDEVRDIKYDNINGKLYMVLPDPNCMQGSLDDIDAVTATVLSRKTTLVDPVGLSQTASISGKENKYYYVGLPFPPVNPQYLLNVIELPTGDSSSVTLVNNNLGLGNMWDTNFTLNVYDTPSSGVAIIGAISPDSSDSKACYPSGFYSLNTVNGTVACTYGPINYDVFPVAEIDTKSNMYYQIFTDRARDFYLFAFDYVKQKVVYQSKCEVCKDLTVLTWLP